MLKKSILFIAFIALFFSCGIVKESSKRRFIEQRAIGSSSLKFNGYYYRLSYYTPSYSSFDSTTDLFFFYKSGKSLQLGSFRGGLIGTEKQLRAQEWGIRIYKGDTLQPKEDIRWTNFSIKRDSIYIERIYPMQVYPHWIFSGYILNDTTFVLTKMEGVYHISYNEKKIRQVNDTFHFKEFHPKPYNPFE